MTDTPTTDATNPEQPTRLYNWTARRSGNSITISGYYAGGRSARIPLVQSIEADAPYPLATTVDGTRFILVTNAAPAQDAQPVDAEPAPLAA